jgi:hypothetical protein
MATLREYFDTDFSKVLKIAYRVKLSNVNFSEEVFVQVHKDFDSNTKYLSVYIGENSSHLEIYRGIINNLDQFLAIGKSNSIQFGLPGEQLMDSANLNFSGRLFLYSENITSEEDIKQLKVEAKDKNLSVQFRGPSFAEERSKIEKPLAFISHDSRDKVQIAKPIAIGLTKLLCPVWFDEFSLKIGDNLRDSIETGIKESKKCILVLSKNFLSNPGWTKTEFDSIFTRELIEYKNVILPIWVDVTKKEVYVYSPILANKIAIKWDAGESEVIKKIYQVLK